MIFYTFIKVIPLELQQKTVQYIKNNCFIISHSSCVHNLSCILHYVLHGKTWLRDIISNDHNYITCIWTKNHRSSRMGLA